MRCLLLAAILAGPFMASANPELNESDVVAPRRYLPQPTASTVVIHFNKKGEAIEKLAFAQLAAIAEQKKSLQDSTPATELKDAQGSPQWGFLWGPSWGYGGAFDRSWDAYDQGYGGNLGGYGGGYWGGYNSTVASWYQSPVYNYYFGARYYGPVGYYGDPYGGGDYYGMYEPY